MKKAIKLVIIPCLFFLFISSTWVRITLIRPADINVSQHIQTLVVLDRTLPKDKRRNMVEQVLTGEFMRQDEQAIQHTMEGIVSNVLNAPRFNITRATERYIGETSGTIFPDALPWNVVENLCNKYGADAVVAVETLDSDYIITHGTRKVQKKDTHGNKITVIEFTAEGLGTVNIGIRLYDPKERLIADQYQFSEQMRWDAHGGSVTDAAQSILNKVAAINELCFKAGKIYAKRISPGYYVVKRNIYDKPKKNKFLAEGVRKSEVADWEGAIESWKKAIEKGKKDKDKGRSAFNVAVAYEVLGDLDKALDWAAKAYIEFEDKDANDYHRALKNRIRQDNIVKQQLDQ